MRKDDFNVGSYVRAVTISFKIRYQDFTRVFGGNAGGRRKRSGQEIWLI